jgi:hypothetical protein
MNCAAIARALPFALLSEISLAVSVSLSMGQSPHTSKPDAACTPRPGSCQLDIGGGRKPLEGHHATDFLKAAAGRFLEETTLSNCVIDDSFVGRDIEGMTFQNVSACKADFTGAHANRATFQNSDLTHAVFIGAQLEGAKISDGTSLQDARLGASSLDGATITDADMEGANLSGASVKNLYFAPRVLPDPVWMAEVLPDQLETMRSPHNPTALTRLEKQFTDFGLNERASEIVVAIREGQQSEYLSACHAGLPPPDPADIDPTWTTVSRNWLAALGHKVGSCFKYYGQAIAFDGTCKFGLRPWRPLGIVAILAAIWTVILAGWLRAAQQPVVLKVFKTRLRVPQRPQVIMVFKNRKGDDFPISIDTLLRKAYPPPKRAVACVRLAIALSVSSVFNLPFKEVEIGRWLRMVSARDYELRTRGAIRVFTGCLSLLSFYLIALFVLTIFNNPFS